MAKLIGLSGSLRKASYNTALLHNAARLLPAGSTLDIKVIDQVPLYNGDREASEGLPASVRQLQQSLREADALVIATPEYNGSIPGVLKNTIDWLSRPPRDQAKVLSGLAVALMGATVGGMGTANAQSACLPVFRSLRMSLWMAGGTLTVSAAHNKFDENGMLTDAPLREQLANYLNDFINSL